MTEDKTGSLKHGINVFLDTYESNFLWQYFLNLMMVVLIVL